ncbi:MAG: DUF4932 domain-containing protein [Prevotella sp.]|nr:DUF4932 domain-containing protein [Prevotella sp.]
MKKKTILTVLFALLTLSAMAQKKTNDAIKVEVSETVELMSILSRIAGFQEYCMNMGGQYTKDTETWFAEFKSHPIIPYYQNIRAKQGVSHDAVMSMAIHLEIDKGKIKFIGDKGELDRWKNVDIDDFIVRLNDFYTATRFHEFFEQHKVFYAEGLRTYEANVMKYFHQDWYARFYGTEPTEQFRVVIGFTNGGGNYGPSRQLPGQSKEVFAIAGYYVDPETGKVFEDGMAYASTLIHEFNHSFVNPLLEKETNVTMLKDIGQNLLRLSPIGMKRQNYASWNTVLNESVVRAAVIIYMLDNGYSAKQLQQEMYDQVCRDFRWMPELVTALRHYATHRDLYPTLNDYNPEIARCLRSFLDTETVRMKKALE